MNGMNSFRRVKFMLHTETETESCCFIHAARTAPQPTALGSEKWKAARDDNDDDDSDSDWSESVAEPETDGGNSNSNNISNCNALQCDTKCYWLYATTAAIATPTATATSNCNNNNNNGSNCLGRVEESGLVPSQAKSECRWRWQRVRRLQRQVLHQFPLCCCSVFVVFLFFIIYIFFLFYLAFHVII